MAGVGVDALLLSHGADLPWLTGYRAMPLERLTMLVLPVSGDPVLVVPALEAARVPEGDGLFELRPWSEDEDPIEVVADLVRRRRATPGVHGGVQLGLGVSERAWAVTLLRLQQAVEARWCPAAEVTGPLRAVKDEGEIACLRAAGAAADEVASALQAGDLPLVGRREVEVSAEIGHRLLASGHRQVNFAIVGSGPNGASPHHEAGDRRLAVGDLVVCDFGGTMVLHDEVGYCSDITRTVSVGEPSADMTDAYGILRAAQAAAVAAVRPGVRAETVDGVARSVIEDGGFGEFFIHRTGHGIGIEEHEEPYIVAGNHTVLEPGHAFSVEPGIYVPGRFGMRVEDIVVVTEAGAEPLNRANHDLVVIDG